MYINIPKQGLKTVTRDEDESAINFIQSHVAAQINDSLPILPFLVEYHEDVDLHLLENTRFHWYTILSYGNFLHGKEYKNKRQALWDKMKNSNYELVRNSYGVIIDIKG